MKSHIIVLLASLMALSLAGCIDDSFSPSSADVATFSTDSVKFGTLFTGDGSATKQFRVYNTGKKNILIEKIEVVGATEQVHFYINVDGQRGTEFHDVEIRGGDSIYVFVEALIDPDSQTEPTEHTAYVNFTGGSRTKQVTLYALGQNAIRLYNPVCVNDTRLTAELPYIVFDSITVARNATLTLEPGTTIHFHDKACLHVDGTLRAEGTVERPVMLRGDRLDEVIEGVASYELMSGQWGGVRFSADSRGNSLSHTIMGGSTFGVILEDDGSQPDTPLNEAPAVNEARLHLHNCVLHNSSGSVLTANNSIVFATGTEFSDASSHVVSIVGGYASFTHCTFANYYLFSAIHGSIINLDTKLAALRNCIIAGRTGELQRDDFTDSPGVTFDNCLLQSNGSDDINFRNCIWKAEPEFYTVREDYIFDYRLRNESAAIGVGNPGFCVGDVLIDRYGLQRIHSDGTVDVGAYVYTPRD